MPVHIAVAYVIHDDHWFLAHSIRSFSAAGDVFVFASSVPWNGQPGDWRRCVEIAEGEGATVIVGEWSTELEHRSYALEWLKEHGYSHALIPDSDEIADEDLISSFLSIASTRLAQRVYVRMDTYWKRTDCVIRPRERFTPLLLIELDKVFQLEGYEFTGRLYDGGRAMLLAPEFGLLHHLSYVGPDERIARKLGTWSHTGEVDSRWFEKAWLGWDADPLLENFHPTHPTAYGSVERIAIPDLLKDVDDGRENDREVERPARWPKLSVIVPLYGGEDDIRACLKSLEASEDLIEEIVVVDDCSPDDAPEVVAAEFPRVRLIRSSENSGFAGSCNRGFTESKGDVVLFLNSDTVVPRAGLIRLIESLLVSGTIGAVGAMSNHAAYHQGIRPGYVDLAGMDSFARDFAFRDVEDQEVQILIGFCLAARRSTLEEVGGAFDERFVKGMFEDNDLSYRLLRSGYKLKVSARSYVHHKGSQSLTRQSEDPSAIFFRNQQVYFDKWREDVETGYASHLSGERPEPIVFDPERNPSKIRREMEALRKRADISVCMIVRNEERVFRECLRSIEGVFSQVVVVDTGSTDRTVEIAKEFGAEVFHFPWTDSFSEARNESLKHARGKWILWLDADDTLPRRSAESILRAAASAASDISAFVIPVRFTDGGPAGGTQVDHVKLFRNLPGLEFEGRIHEQILGSLRKAGGQIARLDAVVLHSGYDTSAAGQARKRDRDEKLLRLDLEERPGHPFVLFNLGMTAHYLGRHNEAIDWLEQSIAAAEPGESHVRKAYSLLGVSKRELGDTYGALETFSAGLVAVGEDPELRFHSGIVLTAVGRNEDARKEYLAMSTDVSGFFSSVDTAILGPKRAHNLGVVCLNLGSYREAKEHFLSAIGMDFPPAARALFEAALEREDLKVAREALEAMERFEGLNEVWASSLAALTEVRGEDPEQVLSEIVATRPDAHGARLLIARRMLAREDADRAEEHLKVLVSAGNAEAAFYLGINATRRGDFRQALKHMRKARMLNPAHEATFEQIASLEMAIEAEEAESLRPVNPDGKKLLVGSHVNALGPAKCPISVVVVTFNSAECIDVCLRSVLRTLGEDDELIVIDNASADTTWEYLQGLAAAEPRLRIVLNAENVGYSKAANQGLLLSSGAHLVLLNPDTEVFEGWIDGLRTCLLEDVVCAGPVSNTVSGEQFVAHYLPDGFRPPLAELPKMMAEMYPGESIRTRFLAGFCLMLPRWVLNQHGLLDESMELGADDLELSWRLRALGYRLAINLGSFVTHLGSASFASLDEHDRQERVARSDAELIEKIRGYYVKNFPSAQKLWGHSLLNLEQST